MTHERHELEIAGRVVVLRAPAPPEGGRSPFWARAWPGGVVLAAHVLEHLEIAHRHVIDLGCGLGTAGIAAALAGARVTFNDREPDALTFALANARDNGVDGEAVRFDWARVPEALVGRFAVVLCAEAVYHPTEVPAFLGALDALLAPDGTGWIADVERLGTGALATAARQAGFLVRRAVSCPHPAGLPCADGAEPRTIHLYCVSRAGTATVSG